MRRLTFWAQLLLLLVIIYFGIRFGGVALGLLGGLGITLLAFLFGVAPGKPPIEIPASGPPAAGR